MEKKKTEHIIKKIANNCKKHGGIEEEHKKKTDSVGVAIVVDDGANVEEEDIEVASVVDSAGQQL